MLPPPLSLDSHFLTECVFKVNPRSGTAQAAGVGRMARVADDKFVVDCQYGVKTGNLEKQEQDLTKWRYQLTVRTQDDADLPWSFRISMLGFFSISEEYAKGKTRIELEKLVLITGSSMLYGAIRELLLTVSMRGPFHGAYLPSVSFLDMKPKTDEETAAAQEVDSHGNSVNRNETGEVRVIDEPAATKSQKAKPKRSRHKKPTQTTER